MLGHTIDYKLRFKSGREKSIVLNASRNAEPYNPGVPTPDFVAEVVSRHEKHVKHIVPTVFGDAYGDVGFCSNKYKKINGNKYILKGTKVIAFQMIGLLDKSKICITSRANTILACIYTRTPVIAIDESPVSARILRHFGLEDYWHNQETMAIAIEDMLNNFQKHTTLFSEVAEKSVANVRQSYDLLKSYVR